MGEVSIDNFTNLDIVLPHSFLKESILAHESGNTDVIQWIGKEDADILTTNIATCCHNEDNKKLLLISVNRVKFNISERKITCRFSEVSRYSDLQTDEQNPSDAPTCEAKPTDNATESKPNEMVVAEDAIHTEHKIIDSTNPSGVELEKTADLTEATNTPAKRKRGRPRKNLTNKENKDITSKGIISSNISSSEVSERRYGLRGVKLSSVIMRAEKGMGDNVEDKIYQKATIKTETNLSEEIPEGLPGTHEDVESYSSENSQCDEQEKWVDYDPMESDGDHDWTGTLKKKRGRPRKKSKGSVQQRVRRSIDLGDNIPTYRRRPRNNQRSEACKYCKKKFCDYTGVDLHVRRWHQKECDIESYLNELKERKIVICDVCNVSCPDRIQLQMHENRAHYRNDTVKCRVCNKIYKNIQSLRNHISAVHAVKGQPQLCHLCPAKFKWAITLRYHIEEIHEGKMNIVCKVCNKKFYRKAQLTRHERIHGSDESKKLVCPSCGKGFWYECNYQRHMTLVHGPAMENYHCSYCGKGFNQKSAMVSHVQKVHLNIYPFRCPQCKMGIGRRKLLQEHMEKVHNICAIQILSNPMGRFKYGRNSEDLFYCSHCSLSFCYKTKMIEHMHIDHGKEFPYMCKHCCQGFLEKHFLINHLKKAHSSSQDDHEVMDATVPEECTQVMADEINMDSKTRNNLITKLQVFTPWLL